jgi:hypothetical protein
MKETCAFGADIAVSLGLTGGAMKEICAFGAGFRECGKYHHQNTAPEALFS